MNTLKKENLDKCFSLLREFIDEEGDSNTKKGAAVLALAQLQKITAGTGTGAGVPEPRVVCITKPRAA